MGRRKTQPHGGNGGRRCRKQGCGFVLDIRTDGNGGTIASCPGCARTRAGLCLDCPGKLPEPAKKGVPRPLRCPTCRYEHDRKIRNDRDRLNYADNPGPKIRKNRKWRRENAEELKRKEKQKRAAERAKGPPTAIDRLYWREKTRRNRAAAKLKRQQLEVAA